MKIHKKTPESKISKAFTLVELLVGIAIVGILASMLLPALARAKAKAARIKCVNNLAQIGKALIGFSHDNGQRLPWQLTPRQVSNHFGGNYVEDLGSIFSTAAMKSELQTAKTLLSPCDAEREASNEDAQKNWASYNVKANKVIPPSAISYVLIEGADTARPSTILAATRNVTDCDLATAKWAGADEEPIPSNAMTGLNKSQGQLVKTDGSASLSTDADLGASGKLVKGHIWSSGGVTLGHANTLVIGCASDNCIMSPLGWNDDGTYPRRGYVLEKQVGGKSTYKVVIVPGKIQWIDAKKEAEKAGGHLATITTQSEWTTVLALPGADHVWLGGYQVDGAEEPDGGWTWVTGEPWECTAWLAIEPNNSGNEDKYLVMVP